MTKKHFIRIAADIKDMTARGYDARTLRRVASDLCDTFLDLNPAFDKQRFLTACGV